MNQRRSEFQIGDHVQVQVSGKWSEGVVLFRGAHHTGADLYLVRLAGSQDQVNRFGSELRRVEAR